MSTAPTLPPRPRAHPLAEGYDDEQLDAYATAHASALAQRVEELTTEVERISAEKVAEFARAREWARLAGEREQQLADMTQAFRDTRDVLAAAKNEIRVSDQLLTHRQQLLEALPECPAHGPCVPHALEWVERAKALERDLAAMTTAHAVAVELGATYAARADELLVDAAFATRATLASAPAATAEWQEIVFTLMGHACGLYAEGKHDMPAWFFELAEKIARTHVDAATADRVKEVAGQESAHLRAPASGDKPSPTEAAGAAPPAQQAAGWRAEVVSDGDVRVYAPDGETWLLRAAQDGAYGFLHRFALAVAAPQHQGGGK